MNNVINVIKAALVIFVFGMVGCGSATNDGSSSPVTSTVLNAPSGLTALTVSATQVNLSWSDNTTNESGYKIERKTGTGGSYIQIGITATNVTTYSDSTTTASTTYYYRVLATNSAGNSGYSNETSATTSSLGGGTGTVLNAPSGLTALTMSATQVNLSWSDNTTNESGYKIERKTGTGGSYIQIGITATNVTTYSDSTTTASTTYYYRVLATNSAGNSGYSNETSATTSSLGGGTGTSYFPMTIGSTWAYKIIETATGSTLSTLTNQVQSDGRLKYTYGTGSISYITLQTINNEIYISKIDIEPYTLTYSPPQLFMPSNLTIGTSQSSTSTYTDASGSTHPETVIYTVVDYESVSVPAGTFNAFKIQTKTTLDTSSTTTFSWLAPGVGLIKADNISDVVVLTSYQVN